MMLEFSVCNLVTTEDTFYVPSFFGSWIFRRANKYDELVKSIEKGQCANTYFAANDAVHPKTTVEDFYRIYSEIVDVCLVLSFLQARCVTVSQTTQQSEPQFLKLPDEFIRPRTILGFPTLESTESLTEFFNDWLVWHSEYQQRKLRLLLSHWLSALTCFSMEDVFLSLGVQMDIVKQCERQRLGAKLSYYEGMLNASRRYGITPLSTDYKAMRNDIVHEGVLSGSNFRGKAKQDCAVVIADTLNWIDSYFLAITGKLSVINKNRRWRGIEIQGLPAISLR